MFVDPQNVFCFLPCDVHVGSSPSLLERKGNPGYFTVYVILMFPDPITFSVCVCVWKAGMV